MAHQRFRVRTLNEWLQHDLGARRGDILVDRLTVDYRYMLTRFAGTPGEVTGRLLAALADDHLEPVDDLITPDQYRAEIPLRLVSSGDRRPPHQPRRWRPRRP